LGVAERIRFRISRNLILFAAFTLTPVLRLGAIGLPQKSRGLIFFAFPSRRETLPLATPAASFPAFPFTMRPPCLFSIALLALAAAAALPAAETPTAKAAAGAPKAAAAPAPPP
jgi:hypothetical protein